MKKNTKSLLSLILILALVLCMSACGSSTGGEDETAGVTEREIKFGSTSMVGGFGIESLLSTADGIAFDQVYDTLIEKVDGEYAGNLAESWEISDDGLVYTFKIREGITWSDGEPFTAEDVEFTLEYMQECPNMSFNYTNVESVETLDEYSVQVTLYEPSAIFLANLSINPAGLMMPKHAYEEWGEAYGDSVEAIVGTGAYVVTDWQTNVSVTFEARDDYWKGEPVIKTAKYVTVADTNAATVALQTGELDIFFASVNGVAYETLAAAENITFAEYLSTSCPSVYMNVQEGPFTDVLLRQAVAYGINKADALQLAAGGLGETVIYPADIGGHVTANPNFTPSHTYDYDLEKAKELVEQSSYNGETVVIKSYNTDPYATLGVYMQSVLTSIGINAEVEPMERSTFLEQVNEGDVTMCLLGWSDTTYDFSKSFSIYVNSANTGWNGNFGGYINEEVDKLIAQADSTSDNAERTECFRQIIEIYMEDVPSIALYAIKTAYPHTTDIETSDVTSYCLYNYHWA